MIDYNLYSFSNKVLFINNVQDKELVSYHAEILVKEGILTSFVIVDDYAEEALDFFGLTKDCFGAGYYYSISELVSIYLCKTEYLLHFSSDSILEKPIDWIKNAIKKMEGNMKIKVANPTWNGQYQEALAESIEEDDYFYTGFGFSDQCYLIRVKDFKQKIYMEKNSLSERYPVYGGELFEKRVDAWMRNNNYYRITYKLGSYIHPSH
ncbi:hypothetical protein [Pseudoneobacillus sp. C159]